MRRELVCAAGLLLAAVSGGISGVAAQGNAGDMAYCAELSAMYRRFLVTTGQGRQFPDVAASVAIDDCEKGNTAAGIPVLEKKLRDARFTLPKRN